MPSVSQHRALPRPCLYEQETTVTEGHGINIPRCGDSTATEMPVPALPHNKPPFGREAAHDVCRSLFTQPRVQQRCDCLFAHSRSSKPTDRMRLWRPNPSMEPSGPFPNYLESGLHIRQPAAKI